MAITTESRLTGERPQQGVTPDSLLALHQTGHGAVLDRIGDGSRVDGLGLAFGPSSFDAACSSHAIEHFADRAPRRERAG